MELYFINKLPHALGLIETGGFDLLEYDFFEICKEEFELRRIEESDASAAVLHIKSGLDHRGGAFNIFVRSAGIAGAYKNAATFKNSLDLREQIFGILLRKEVNRKVCKNYVKAVIVKG